MRLLLIRHAKIAGDPYACPDERPVRGCLSEDLGVPQARSLARALRAERIDVAFASPYGRALQTAETALAGRDAPLHVRAYLREWLPAPALQAKTATEFEAIVARHEDRYAEETWETELGEGTFALYGRVCPPFLRDLSALGIHHRMGGFVADDGARDLSVAVFAHGGSLNVLLAFLLGVRPFPLGPFSFDLTGVAEIGFRERRGVHYPFLRIPAPTPAEDR